MDAAVRQLVRSRAAECCEYCRLRQDQTPAVALQIEHIVPKKHGGDDEEGNLALACQHCDLHKGPNLSGIDPQTGEVVTLFHPRQQSWGDHFEMNGPIVVGRTPLGRATVRVFNMNTPSRVQLRSTT